MSDPLMQHLTPDEVELWAQGLPEFGFVERVMAKVKIPTPSGPHLRPHTDS